MNSPLLRLLSDYSLQADTAATPEHSVARCVWDTTLDDKAMSHRLQEHLSNWSKTRLNKLLEQVFEHYCPAGQIGRIDSMTLDLGEITFDELHTELPKRVEACLHEQFRRMLVNTGWRADSVSRTEPDIESPISSQMLSQPRSLNEFIGYFLRNGTLPWWYTGKERHAEILLKQLLDAPEQTAATIRDAGKSEAVRKRIAWQYQPAVIKKIIVVLEPYHHEYIVAYADNLQQQQAKTQMPKSDRRVFERQSWFWILTHLLVERGSLFNTMAFVESTIKQMAHSYQVDYRTLLQHLVTAVQSLEDKGSIRPQFIQALLGLQQKCLPENAPSPSDKSSMDHWQLFSDRLQGQAFNGVDTVHTGELFSLLTDENPGKLAALLRHKARQPKVRQQLIAGLDAAGLNRLLSVLAPQDSPFISAYVQSYAAVAQSQANQKQGWDLIFVYLLEADGGQFTRRQFVSDTLLKLSKAQGIDYKILLDLLTGAALSTANQSQHLALLAVLNELKRQYPPRDVQEPSIDAVYCQALMAYLATGHAPKVIGKHYLPAVELIFSTLLYRQAPPLAMSLAEVFKASGKVSHPALSQRLLALIQPADFPFMLRTLDAEAAPFALSLVTLLTRWQSQHGLPSLNGFDVYNGLHGLVIGVLIEHLGSDFTVAGFMRAFFAALSTSHGINCLALATEMASNLAQASAQDRTGNPELQTLMQWLSSTKAKHENLAGDVTKQASDDTVLAQKITALLRGDKSGLERFGLAKSSRKTALPKLLASLRPSDSSPLLEQLQQQTDRKALAEALLKHDDSPEVQQWLGSLWQTDDPAQTLLSEWQSALVHSGLWQGSTKLLQQKLHDIFWLSVLDHALSMHRPLNQADMDALLEQIVALSCAQLHIGLKPLVQSNSIAQAPRWQSALLRLAETEAELLTAVIPQGTDQRLSHAKDTGQPSGQAIAKRSNKPQPTTDLDASTAFVQDKQRHYLKHPLLPKLLEHLLLHGCPPLWLQTSKPLDIQQMIADLLHDHPQSLHDIIKRIQHEPNALFRLHHLLDFKHLQAAVVQTNPELKTLLSVLSDVFQGLLQLRIPGVDADFLTAVLWQKTLLAWLSGDWESVSAERIFLVLSAELMRRHVMSPESIAAEFKRNAQHFPKECSMALPDEPTQAHQAAATPKSSLKKTPPLNKETSSKPTGKTMPIQISNAGLVMLQGFISTYFNRLGLVEDATFCSPEAQRKAVHGLQYLATGLTATEEQHLVLNKLLCGLLPSDPVELGFDLTPEDKTTGDSLIEAVIHYWPAIGSSSIDGFRGNWLVRNGLLSQSEGRWDLVVEKRAYDLLLQSSPFSFQLIKLPWMTSPLYVTWPT